MSIQHPLKAEQHMLKSGVETDSFQKLHPFLLCMPHILNEAQTTCCLLPTIWHSTFISGFPPEDSEEGFADSFPLNKSNDGVDPVISIKLYAESQFPSFLAKP
jgi:hypothetical protein